MIHELYRTTKLDERARDVLVEFSTGGIGFFGLNLLLGNIGLGMHGLFFALAGATGYSVISNERNRQYNNFINQTPKDRLFSDEVMQDDQKRKMAKVYAQENDLFEEFRASLEDYIERKYPLVTR